MAEQTNADQEIVEAGYDAVYTALPRAETLRRIWRSHALGPEYPSGFEHISFLSPSELERMATQLRIGAGMTLVDLGCGEGGPGLWIAQRTGAHLIGIDLSAVGVAHAAQRAGELGLEDRSRFATGSFAQTGLTANSCQGAISVDALQYAPDKRAAIAEVARMLSSGGRFVFAAFEVDPTRAQGLPVLGTDPVDDYRPVLEEGGFAVDSYEESASWRERLDATYEAVLSQREELTDEMGEEAMAPLLMEVTLTLQHQPYRRRILAVSTRQ
jgi:ubiquinone/menaquinone biosynthesis C-methylase UbiE